MKLDRTFIAIRERGVLEIFDLAIQVTRQYLRPLILLLILGACPYIIIDFALIGWLTYSVYEEIYFAYFYWLMAALVINQAHVGTTLITCYLGQVLFVEQQSVRQILKESFIKPWLYWGNHGFIRLVFPMLVVVGLTWTSDRNWLNLMSLLCVPALLITSVVVRGIRPFATEIIMLEKTSAKSSSPTRINFKTRSSNLHDQANGELVSRSTIGAMVFSLIFLGIYALLNLLDSTLLLQATTEFPLRPIYWTIALWLTAGFAAVFRFLSYIDIRIRQEGWAVELKMRAEGQRLRGVEVV